MTDNPFWCSQCSTNYKDHCLCPKATDEPGKTLEQFASNERKMFLRITELEQEKSERYKLLKDNTYTIAQLGSEMERLRHKVQCIAFNMMDGIGSYDDDGTIDDILHTYWEALEKALKGEE